MSKLDIFHTLAPRILEDEKTSTISVYANFDEPIKSEAHDIEDLITAVERNFNNARFFISDSTKTERLAIHIDNRTVEFSITDTGTIKKQTIFEFKDFPSRLVDQYDPNIGLSMAWEIVERLKDDGIEFKNEDKAVLASALVIKVWRDEEILSSVSNQPRHNPGLDLT